MDLKILDPIKESNGSRNVMSMRYQKLFIIFMPSTLPNHSQKFQTNELPSSTVGQKRRRKLGTVIRILNSYIPVCVKCSVERESIDKNPVKVVPFPCWVPHG